MHWTFLVIDPSEPDTETTAQLILRIMPQAEILRATSGEAALSLVEGRRVVPSMVFLAFDLADMNAIQFLGYLRERRWLDRAPACLLTDPIDDRLIVTCYRLGAAAFLTKPVRLHELRETIRDFGVPAMTMTSATVLAPGAGPVRQTAA